MNSCEAFIIGGSAGSLDVIMRVLPLLRPDLSFPLIIVLHRRPGADSMLTGLLKSRTTLEVKEVEEKEKIRPATIYIAPSNYHLLVENDRTFSLDASEKVNYSRPSLDVIFESAAEVYAENLVCLLLSGSNDDGVQGLAAAKARGGRAVIQDPDSAVVSYMPAQAMVNVRLDQVLAIEEIADYINNLSE